MTVGDVLLYLGQMFQITDSLPTYVGIAHQELVLTSLLPSTIFWLTMCDEAEKQWCVLQVYHSDGYSTGGPRPA